MWLYESWLARDARWVAGLAAVYALAVIAAVLTLNRYFSQTWDVITFVSAARNLLGPNWTALYAQTRVEQQWPYAYPPLHTAVIAPLLTFAGLIPAWLLARLPPLVADLGVGALLYALIAHKTAQRAPARLALTVWLFNPVTFYDTAVQGHFEAEWLFFVLLAYALAQARRGLVLPTLALAGAFLFKQVAILFAIPYWLWLLAARAGTYAEAPLRKRITTVAASGLLFALPVLLVSLPFLLYSGDYVYMNLQYVAVVPLQTQSWLVALDGMLGPNFFLLQHSTVILLVASLLIALISLARGRNLHFTATLIALAFFLLSQKVMGYYYVMLLPFALVEFIPARRFGLLTLIVAATAWISLSPYLAAWANPNHLPFYAALGVLNSLFWLALFVYLCVSPLRLKGTEIGVRGLIFLSLALFSEAVAAALVQPLVNNPTSPIRAPIIPSGLELNVLFAFVVFVLLLLAAFVVIAALTRRWASVVVLPRALFALALTLAPLYFLTFSLTKESTAFFEIALKSLGL
jgi:hypothetical protein